MSYPIKQLRDTLAINLIDVKKGPDGYKVVEMGGPSCNCIIATNERIAQCCQDSRFNPLQKPVYALNRKKQGHQTYDRTVTNLQSVSDLEGRVFAHTHSKTIPSWNSYGGILLRLAPDAIPFSYDQTDCMVANDPILWDIGQSKEKAAYIIDSQISPRTAIFHSEEELVEKLRDFKGSNVYLKADTDTDLEGVYFVKNANIDKAVELYRFLDACVAVSGLEGHVDPRPCIIQEEIKDTPITTREGITGVSIDRVGFIMSCVEGNISVEFLGGAHRVKTNDDPVVYCSRGNAAVKYMTPDTEAEIVADILPGMIETYHRALQIPLSNSVENLSAEDIKAFYK